MESLTRAFFRTTGGHHGLDDTSDNNRTYIGSRRRRLLWPGTLVLDRRSVRRQGIVHLSGLVPARSGDRRSLACHVLTMNRVRARRGDQAPGGIEDADPIRAASSRLAVLHNGLHYRVSVNAGRKRMQIWRSEIFAYWSSFSRIPWNLLFSYLHGEVPKRPTHQHFNR